MLLSPSITVITFYAPSSSGGNAFTMAHRFYTNCRHALHQVNDVPGVVYLGNPQSFGSLTIPLSLSVVIL